MIVSVRSVRLLVTGCCDCRGGRSITSFSKNGLDMGFNPDYEKETQKNHARSNHILSRHRIDGVESHRAENVPRAHLPTIFVLSRHQHKRTHGRQHAASPQKAQSAHPHNCLWQPPSLVPESCTPRPRVRISTVYGGRARYSVQSNIQKE